MTLIEDYIDALQEDGFRKIRNIEFNYLDVSAIVEDEKKIPGTVINVFGAVLQQRTEAVADDMPWCIFSTWLGDLIQERASARAVGTFEEHVQMALLLRIVDEIRRCLKAEPIKWGQGWKRENLSPIPLECQFDNWSCGLFVMMAIMAVTEQWNWDKVSNSRKNTIRHIALEALISVEKVSRRKKRAAQETPDNGLNKIEVVDKMLDVKDNEDSSIEPQLGKSIDMTSENKCRRIETDYDHNNTDDKQATVQHFTHTKKRAPKKNASDRRSAFVNDDLVSNIEEHRVRCKACYKWIKLSTRTTFEIKNWEAHKKVCPQITGFKTERVQLVKPKVHPKTGASSITSYFTGSTKKSDTTTSFSDTAQSESSGHAYILRTVKTQTRSISQIFPSVTTPFQAQPRPVVPCTGLSGEQFEEYIIRSRTRKYGGISPAMRARVARQVFPYKPFPPLQSKELAFKHVGVPIKWEVPEWGNKDVEVLFWTSTEKLQFDMTLMAWARWELDSVLRVVRSTRCHGTTSNKSKLCDTCTSVKDDPSFKKAVKRANEESKLPAEEQQAALALRIKYAPRTVLSLEAHTLLKKLQDPVLFEVHRLLERDQDTDCFLQLYMHAQDGNLKNLDVFRDVCEVLVDKLNRDLSSNPNANSADTLQNPHLIYENLAKVKRLVNAIGYTGPVSFASDCTKVRPRLTYSNDYGGHVLGSVLPIELCKVLEATDIDDIISKVKEEKALGTQVRVYMVKIPLPQIPPQIVAALPTISGGDSDFVYLQQIKALKMAGNLKLPVISFAADGASAELSAQNTMDKVASELAPITYDYPLYGIYLRAPVLNDTGPLVSITDPPHARKTCRNQPQHGTHTASLGIGYLVNRSLVDLYRCSGSGLVLRDVENADKQDDGAARRAFHETALFSLTVKDLAGAVTIKENFHGLFIYLFIFGNLFDAWISRTMATRDRILSALRARFFLHMWRKHILKLASNFPDLYSTTRSFISPTSFHIFNRLCDSLVLLALVYSECYPNQPFCPWLMGTDFVEHFFGLTRMILPNFNYGEFLKMVKHIELRQKLLLSGKFKQDRERHSASGYIMDYDASPLTSDDKKLATVKLSHHDLNNLVELGFHEAYQICKDLLKISASLPTIDAPIDLVPLGSVPPRAQTSCSESKSSDVDSDTESDIDFDSDVGDGENIYSTDLSFKAITTSAAHDAARYAAICEDIDSLVAHRDDPDISRDIPLPPTIESLNLSISMDNSTSKYLPKSELFDGSGHVSISAMLEYRKRLQSGTTVHSERSVKLNPKFDAAEKERQATLQKSGVAMKMSIKEVSHRLRLGQQLDGTLQKTQPKKDREMRWLSIAQNLRSLLVPGELPNLAGKNVNDLFPMKIGNYAILRTEKRIYIGEILDMYKKAASGRYGSVADVGKAALLQAISVHVYLPLTMVGQLKERFMLKEGASAHWESLTRRDIAKKLPKLMIRIPARKQNK
ncbi:hypothetical protein C0992_001720 [Termitomyces sp. T32_za158]|nr:hypothetical protein C0992_001720 [Termitomyces sp. T32_za158]